MRLRPRANAEDSNKKSLSPNVFSNIPRPRLMLPRAAVIFVFRFAIGIVLYLSLLVPAGLAQEGAQTPKKINERPASAPVNKAEPFDGATVSKMAQQCVTLETESGEIVIEMIAEAAPESARNFLNLAATGALDTTTFSRVVKGFVIQGGNLSTSERWGTELSERMRRTIPDEPSYVKHLRGVVSMARPETPNSASTHFFILVDQAPMLDGKFAAFGRVIKGMEVVDAINQMPAENEKPAKPVRIARARVAPCAK